jgi:hypothetical protein
MSMPRQARAANLKLDTGAQQKLLECTKELSSLVAKEGKRLRKMAALEREVAGLREGLKSKEEEVGRQRRAWQELLVSHPGAPLTASLGLPIPMLLPSMGSARLLHTVHQLPIATARA